MNFEYAKDSKEQRPYEHYLNAYREMDPRSAGEPVFLMMRKRGFLP